MQSVDKSDHSTKTAISLIKEDILITTFNIHYIYEGQKKMKWDERKSAVLKALSNSDSDIIVFQEMETFSGSNISTENIQLDYLLNKMPEYEASAVGNPYTFPSTQPILYKSRKFTKLDQGYFFFSKLPDNIYSNTWNGGYPAYCVWVKFEDKRNNRIFTVYNMHNDYKSKTNRVKASELILERMKSDLDNNTAVILAGDFNALKNFKPVKIFTNAGFKIAETKGSSFHFNRGLNIFAAIDHILFTDHFKESGNFINRQKYSSIYPSDHYPVSAVLSWW